MYNDPLPSRVRLLVLGGGIHGVGVLHDVVSRGWQDVHLIEKSLIGAGTSSRSTKLIHGGLRYLKNVRDFPLVSEALKERKVLMSLAGDLVKPIELYLPVLEGEGMPGFVLKTGLALYDFLAAKAKIKPHRKVSPEEAARNAPVLNLDVVKSVYSFWDTQTDDLALVRRVCASARKLGAGVTEQCRARSIRASEDGWIVEVELPNGEVQEISALYVLNAMGPWANMFLEQSRVKPIYRGVNSEGIHLIFDDLGLKAGMFLQVPADKRIFFMLPWQGYTLVGTTEQIYSGDPDELKIKRDSVQYLMDQCNRYLKTPLKEEQIRASFSGLRWLAMDEERDLSSTSRAYVIGEHASSRGLLMTIYGGKLTTYRNLSKTIGDRITRHFGEFRPSTTDQGAAWVTKEEMPLYEQGILERFRPGGLAYAALANSNVIPSP